MWTDKCETYILITVSKAFEGNCDQVLASHILVQFFVMVIQTIVTLSTIIFGKKLQWTHD